MSRLFNGTSDRIDLANEANFDVIDRLQPFTVSAWIRQNANVGGCIVGKQTTVPKGWFFGLETFNGPRLFTQIDDGVGPAQAESVGAFSLGSWHHVGMAYDGSSSVSGISMYIDGSLQTRTNEVDTLTASIVNDIPVQIGARGGTSTPEVFLGGELADVAVWSSQLSAAQIALLAGGTSPLDVAVSSLISFLPLCGLDPLERDLFGPNDGTLFGTKGTPHPTANCGSVGGFARRGLARAS